MTAMIKDSLKLLEHYDFTTTTEANGKLYQHKTEDKCAIEYPNRIKFFYNRMKQYIGNDCYPCFFENCEVVNKT